MGEDAGESDVFPAMHFASPRTQSGTQRAGNRSVRYTLPEPFSPPRCSLTRPSRRQNDRLRAIQRVLLRMHQLHIASRSARGRPT